MTYTPFYEGDQVSSVGGDAVGKLISVASQSAAWVNWESGSRSGLDLVDLRDIEPIQVVAAPRQVVATVRSVYAAQGGDGVVDFLAASGQLGDWPLIAEGALNFVVGRLRGSLSMDLPYEELSDDAREDVLHTAALRLLRDAVTPEEQ